MPATVAIAARAEAELSGDPLHQDLADRLPVTAVSLMAAAGSPDPVVADWAGGYYRRLYTEREAKIDRALIAAGYGDCYGCDERHTAYGILDPQMLDQDQEVISQIIRRTLDGGLERWEGSGWASVPDELHPTGLQYIELDAAMLAELLDTVDRAAGLILRPVQPRGFLTPSMLGPMVAAANTVTDQTAPGSVFAVVDEMDSSAVLTLFAVAPGPVVHLRLNGQWLPDDGHLLTSLESIDPPTVVQVPPADLPNVLRQIDDHDKTSPQPMPRTLTAAGNYAGVMVALPLSAEHAGQLAVPGGEDPADMHVTLAYLGDPEDAGIEPQALLDLVKQWAADAPDALDGAISGPAVFKPEDEDDDPAHVALVDCPQLPDLRQDLVRRLQAAGANVNQEHGYTPHITRAYGDTALADPDADDETERDESEYERTPALMDLDHQPIHFDHVGVYYGNDRGYVPLSNPDAAFDPDRGPGDLPPTITAAAVGWNEQLHPRQGGKFAAKGTQTQAQPAVNPANVSQYIATGDTTGIPTALQAKAAKGKAAGGSAAKLAAAQKALAAKIAAAKARRVKAIQQHYSTLHAQAQAQHQNAQDQYTLERAKADSAEQAHRDQFDTGLNAMFQGLKKQGLSDNEAALKVQQAAQAETQRRQTWETERKSAVADENIRRIQARIITRNNMTRDNSRMAHEIALVGAGGSAKPAHSLMPPAFQRFWTVGDGGAKIRWGSSGDWARCRRSLAKHIHDPHALDGACANLHRLITGEWPGPHAHEGQALVAASATREGEHLAGDPGAAWNEALHPRGRDGKWITRGGKIDAFEDGSHRPSIQAVAEGVHDDPRLGTVVTARVTTPGHFQGVAHRAGDTVQLLPKNIEAAPEARAHLDPQAGHGFTDLSDEAVRQHLFSPDRNKAAAARQELKARQTRPAEPMATPSEFDGLDDSQVRESLFSPDRQKATAARQELARRRAEPSTAPQPAPAVPAPAATQPPVQLPTGTRVERDRIGSYRVEHNGGPGQPKWTLDTVAAGDDDQGHRMMQESDAQQLGQQTEAVNRLLQQANLTDPRGVRLEATRGPNGALYLADHDTHHGIGYIRADGTVKVDKSHERDLGSGRWDRGPFSTHAQLDVGHISHPAPALTPDQRVNRLLQEHGPDRTKWSEDALQSAVRDNDPQARVELARRHAPPPAPAPSPSPAPTPAIHTAPPVAVSPEVQRLMDYTQQRLNSPLAQYGADRRHWPDPDLRQAATTGDRSAQDELVRRHGATAGRRRRGRWIPA